MCSADPLGAQASAADTAVEWTVELRNRAFIIPERVVSGLPLQPTVAVRWRPRPSWRLVLDAQTVDNSGPGVQGPWLASRTVPGGGSGNFLQEWTLEIGRIWNDRPSQRTRWGLDVSYSRAVRSYHAVDTASGQEIGGNRQRGVAAAQLYAALAHDGGVVDVGVAGAALARSDAMYVRRLPGESRSFGPLAGAFLAGRWHATSKLGLVWRSFTPFVGRNAISRTSGRPVRVVAYDAGVALRLSRHAEGELFVSNALGNTGALALVADREYRAIGTALRIHSGGSPPNGSVDEDAWGASGAPIALAALAAPSRGAGGVELRARLGSGGLLIAGEWAPVPGVQGGVFLDYLRGRDDEGELGAMLRVGLSDFAQSAGGTRVGVTVSASRTNNPLVNLLAADRREIDRLGLPKGDFRFGDEDVNEGRLYVIAAAVPVEIGVRSRTRVRVAPTLGYVQRRGLQLSGVAMGIERDVEHRVTLAADGGVPIGRANVVLTGRRGYAVPWGATVAWRPWAWAGREVLSLEAFVSNRAGDSPFHALRVRAGGGVAFGGGLRVAWPR